MQEKYGKSDLYQTNDESLESSSDEEEDDDGVLAAGVLDAEVQDTLAAIQRKDPRVYDPSVKFYTDAEQQPSEDLAIGGKGPKAISLKDYHRKQLLGGASEVEISQPQPSSYVQQQQDLRLSIVREIHGSAGRTIISDDTERKEDEFLVEKPMKSNTMATMKESKPHLESLDVETADQNPDKYLANFFSNRAWVPNGVSRFQAFDSDDEEEEHRADKFEEAYNLRFENPANSNEKLISHARDAAVRYSVRKENTKSRKKGREELRAKKEAEKQTRREEKARLRKLKVSELEYKLQKVRDAAGLSTDSLKDEDFSALLDEAWDDARWNEIMQQRFGTGYYEGNDLIDEGRTTIQGKKKFKKPKWDEDINIDDLVPEFNLQEVEPDLESEHADNGDSNSTANSKTEPTSRLHAQEGNLTGKRKDLRLERREIENMVNESFDIDEKLHALGKKHLSFFRYRETSPTSWGLTSADILMADDSHLNQFAGLKKLAAFRDPERKRKDKKHLAKKARLRKWRIDTFGSEDALQSGNLDPAYTLLPSKGRMANNVSEGNGIKEGEPNQKGRKNRG